MRIFRESGYIQAKEHTQLQTQIDDVDAKLMAWHRADECSQRLAKIPGVGPIGAFQLTMKTPDPPCRPSQCLPLRIGTHRPRTHANFVGGTVASVTNEARIMRIEGHYH